MKKYFLRKCKPHVYCINNYEFIFTKYFVTNSACGIMNPYKFDITKTRRVFDYEYILLDDSNGPISANYDV